MMATADREVLIRSRLWRRLIPFAAGVVVAGVTSLPVTVDWFTLSGGDRWTLLFCTAVFLFKSYLFVAMRYRMTQQSRRLTVFGTALVDFFTSLTALAIVLAAVFGILYIYAAHGIFRPQWFTVITRSAIAGAGSFVVGTGIAVVWEMRRAGDRLAVHHDSLPP